MDEDVSAPGERDQIVGRRGIAGDDDRPVGGVEAKGERRDDGRMIDQR